MISGSAAHADSISQHGKGLMHGGASKEGQHRVGLVFSEFYLDFHLNQNQRVYEDICCE